MKRLRVDTLPIAEQQILDQVLYIAQDSLKNALAWEERLRAEIATIGDMPGHSVDEEASGRLGYQVRKMTFEGTYLIHYRIIESAGVIEILNFRHGARLARRGEP